MIQGQARPIRAALAVGRLPGRLDQGIGLMVDDLVGAARGRDHPGAGGLGELECRNKTSDGQAETDAEPAELAH